MLYSSVGDAVFPYSVASSSSWYKAAATNRVATLNQVPCVCIGTPNHQWPFTFLGQRPGQETREDPCDSVQMECLVVIPLI